MPANTLLEEKVENIALHVDAYTSKGLKMVATSSFQTHSIPMLHILSRINASIPIYFLDTGYHFPETIEFRDAIATDLGLNLKNQRSSIPRNQHRNANGDFYFASDPDLCCFLNKTQPMEPILAGADVWINGVRADQNANRRNMTMEQATPDGTIRFHPMLDWTNKMIWEYREAYNLPEHPLEQQGYFSIGCEPCTRKFNLDEGRDGRWFGLNKTECGLHTDLVK